MDENASAAVDTAAPAVDQGVQDVQSAPNASLEQSAPQTNAQSETQNGGEVLTDTLHENGKSTEELQKQPSTIPEIYELVAKNGAPAEDAADFQEIFKKAGLTAKQAQAMYDAYNLKSNDIAEQFKQAVMQKNDADMQAVRSDPELGGANFDNTKMYIGKAMDTFGTPALREKLRTAGFGNDPDFVRFVAKVGKAFSNDEFIGGHGSNKKANDYQATAKALYSNSPELWHE